MTVMESSKLLGFLEASTQKDWLDAVAEIEPSIDPVDRAATRVWFAFWPLDLREALESPDGREHVARLMDLEGDWNIEKHLDRSVSLLYGAHYWPSVKKAVLSQEAPSGSLAETIRSVASRAAESAGVDASVVLGASAAGLMIFRQVGQEALARVVDRPAEGDLLPRDRDLVLSRRERKSRDGLMTFLKGLSRRWEVRWNEAKGSVFRAITGQDVAMAGAQDGGDYRAVDYRRIDGPIPVECRVGSCGYCWVGVLAGRENLSEITKFERERLRYFGYDTANEEDDLRPPVRLACQAQCHGDVTVTVPLWNGELSRRHHEGRKKLGLA